MKFICHATARPEPHGVGSEQDVTGRQIAVLKHALGTQVAADRCRQALETGHEIAFDPPDATGVNVLIENLLKREKDLP